MLLMLSASTEKTQRLLTRSLLGTWWPYEVPFRSRRVGHAPSVPKQIWSGPVKKLRRPVRSCSAWEAAEEFLWPKLHCAPGSAIKRPGT